LGKHDLTINISASPSFEQRFGVDIYKRSNSVKLVYCLFDSIKFSGLKKDTAYQSFYSQFQKIKMEVPEWEKKLHAFLERYTAYTRDSIVINLKKDTSYNNVLLKVAKATKEQLELKRNVGFDGVSVAYTITTSTGITTAYAHSPTAVSQPLLYSLLTRSLAIYRQEKPDGILKRRSTARY